MRDARKTCQISVRPFSIWRASSTSPSRVSKLTVPIQSRYDWIVSLAPLFREGVARAAWPALDGRSTKGMPDAANFRVNRCTTSASHVDRAMADETSSNVRKPWAFPLSTSSLNRFRVVSVKVVLPSWGAGVRVAMGCVRMSGVGGAIRLEGDADVWGSAGDSSEGSCPGRTSMQCSGQRMNPATHARSREKLCKRSTRLCGHVARRPAPNSRF